MKLDLNNVGKRIAFKRKDLNMRQSNLAMHCGISVNHISNIENGNTVPSLKTLCDICTALGVTTDYVLLGNIKNDISSDITDALKLCDDKEKDIVYEIIKAFIKGKK